MQAKISIVLATHNKGKKAEIKDLLANYPVEILDLNDFGPIPAIVEDGATFDENAYKKASLTARYLGFPALADDSGLCVEALGGAPGVFSARYAGDQATDAQRCQKLLHEMKFHADRAAYFECVLSLAVPGGAALTYEARCEGVIGQEPLGTLGFGYDPIFFFPPLNRTFAQLSREEKNRVSHRGKALIEMRDEFDKVLIWIQQQMPPQEPIGCLGNSKGS
jgi:XTP/dITP diphosphohydrolase